MPDICDLILDDHEQFRRRFAELDHERAADTGKDRLAALWEPLAGMLERHASAEEALFYPKLLDRGANAEEETDDAIGDHNDIRKAVARAADAEAGTDDWWSAVLDARDENSKHMGEEERESLPDFREHVDDDVREDLGTRWLGYSTEHAGGAGLSGQTKDVDSYVEQHS